MMLLVQAPTPPLPPASPSQGGITQVPAAPGVATPQLMPIEALQARELQLNEQISILRGQRALAVRQLRARDPVMRTGALEQLKAVDAQLASAQSELSSVQAQIALRVPGRNIRQGQPGAYQPDGGNRGGLNGDMVTGIFITFTLAVLMPISIGISRRLWRRTPASITPDIIAPRLDRLEQAVDAIAIEIERISEGQRFVTKVMTERPAQARSVVSAPEMHDASALGEAKPFLALGAGAVEPIRVPERQKVRQSNTPH